MRLWPGPGLDCWQARALPHTEEMQEMSEQEMADGRSTGAVRGSPGSSPLARLSLLSPPSSPSFPSPSPSLSLSRSLSRSFLPPLSEGSQR